MSCRCALFHCFIDAAILSHSPCVGQRIGEVLATSSGEREATVTDGGGVARELLWKARRTVLLYWLLYIANESVPSEIATHTCARITEAKGTDLCLRSSLATPGRWIEVEKEHELDVEKPLFWPLCPLI